jgi:hypothetical protein
VISGCHGSTYEVYRVFWDVAPSSHVDVYRCFGGAYCFHHQGNIFLELFSERCHFLLEFLHVTDYEGTMKPRGAKRMYRPIWYCYICEVPLAQ